MGIGSLESPDQGWPVGNISFVNSEKSHQLRLVSPCPKVDYFCTNWKYRPRASHRTHPWWIWSSEPLSNSQRKFWVHLETLISKPKLTRESKYCQNTFCKSSLSPRDTGEWFRNWLGSKQSKWHQSRLVSYEEFLTVEHIFGFPYSCASQIYPL